MVIKAGIIGTGIGLKHYEAIHNFRGSKVKTIVEINKKKIAKLRKKFPNLKISTNENDIFNDKDINLVSIASYDNYHFKHILKALKNNKNIIVEKPMCLNIQELKIIKNMLKKKKIKMISNLVLRKNSLFKQLKKIVKNDKIYYIEGDYLWGRKSKLFEWRSKVKNYTSTLGAAIHIFDLILWITGQKPVSVMTFGNNIACNNTVFKKESFLIYILEFKNNLIAKVTANLACSYKHFHEIKIFGEKNTLVHSLPSTYKFTPKKKMNILKKIKNSYPENFNKKKLIQDFIQNVNKNTASIMSHQDQFDLMSLCFAADKSFKNNKKVKIKYI
jgi:predicted dehydrogenase